MRRFIKDDRARFFLEQLKPSLAPDRLGREKTFEDETVRRQPRRRQRRNQRTGARNRNHLNARCPRLTHQVIARIGNQRRACVRNQRNVIACLQARDEATALVPFVVFVAGRQRRGDAEMLHQP